MKEQEAKLLSAQGKKLGCSMGKYMKENNPNYLKSKKKKKKDGYVEFSKLPLNLKKQLMTFMVKNNVEFEKDLMASNFQTMVAKLEIKGVGGKKAKVKLTKLDIERLCRKRNSIDGGYHKKCKNEKWL